MPQRLRRCTLARSEWNASPFDPRLGTRPDQPPAAKSFRRLHLVGAGTHPAPPTLDNFPTYLESDTRMKSRIETLVSQIGQIIVGKEDAVRLATACLLARGHLLIEDVPGVGKTTLAHTLARSLGLQFRRLQFTSDLLPADIVGNSIFDREQQRFVFHAGPLFSQVVLIDEINRATPKTQSALLEAMQEQHVTVGGTQHPLEPPFLVLATQNPLEMEGTYPLPEAQLDRFFFKLKVLFPTADDLQTILDRTTAKESPVVSKVLHSTEEVVAMREIVRQVPLTKEVQTHAIDVVLATHPDNPRATPLTKKYVRYGASPRGAQALILAGKIHALLDGRYHVSRADIDQAAPAALRHRIILNFEGEAEGTSTDEVIAEILKQTAG